MGLYTTKHECPHCGSGNIAFAGYAGGDDEEFECDECENFFVITSPDDDESEPCDESMDGDHESALASAGFGTDEDYGSYGGDDY